MTICKTFTDLVLTMLIVYNEVCRYYVKVFLIG